MPFAISLATPCPARSSPRDAVRTSDISSVLTAASSALSTSTPATPIDGTASSGAPMSKPKNRAPCRVAAFSVIAFSSTLCGT